MSDQRIVPEKITKPIQLLGAWLAGLILVNGSFLGSAVMIPSPDSIRVLLVIACILNVPLFLFCLFRLQTKFRPEMQEDIYYAKYLELSTGKLVTKDSASLSLQQLKAELSDSQEKSGRALQSLEQQLRSLSHQIDGIREQSGSSPLLEALSSAASEAEKSAQVIETAFKQAQESVVAVQVNDLIPNYADLRAALDANGVAVSSTFGSSSSPPESPTALDIGFGRNVPVDILKNVIKVARPFGFDRLHFSPEPYSENNVYVGSYVHRHPDSPQPVPIDGEILAMLERGHFSAKELIGAISRKQNSQH